MARNQRFIGFISNFTEHGFYLKISESFRAGYTIQKIDSHVPLIPRILPLNGDPSVLMVIGVKWSKLSILVDQTDLLLGGTISPTNMHYSYMYGPNLGAFTIPEVIERPTIVSASAAHDAREICQYNQKRGIESNISVNRRSRRHPKRGGAIQV